MKSSIALMSLHTGYDLKLFVKSFSKLLNRFQTCEVLSSQSIFPQNRSVAQAKSNSIFERSLMEIIQRFKNENDAIIYLLDDDFSNWSKRNLEEVDEVWVIGKYGHDTELTPIAKQLIHQQTHKKMSLIVEYANKTVEQEESKHWLISNAIDHFYSISKNNLTDLEKLVAIYIKDNQTTSLIKREAA